MPLELNIQDICGDMARANLFEVEVPYLGENFKFYCKSASLPASSVKPVKVGYQNRSINYAADREFASWKLTVYNDDQQSIRALFLSWGELIQSHGRTLVGALPSEYKQAGFVTQFDRANNETAKFKFTGIWPSEIGEIQLTWGEGGEVETFEVTMEVDWFEPV